MKIEQMKLADVKPYERNPRINDNAVEAWLCSCDHVSAQEHLTYFVNT